MSSQEVELSFLRPWTEEDDRALEIYDKTLQAEQRAEALRAIESPVTERFGRAFLAYAAGIICTELKAPEPVDNSDLS